MLLVLYMKTNLQTHNFKADFSNFHELCMKDIKYLFYSWYEHVSHFVTCLLIYDHVTRSSKLRQSFPL